MKKTVVYLDMDGTIADLYGMENWLERLMQEDAHLFEECEPFITEEELFQYLPTEQYEIRICSMTPKDATKEFCDAVVIAKNRWLDRFFPAITNRHYLPYGNNKNYKHSEQCMLIDDNAEIRKTYRGTALYPMWL